MCLSVEQLNKIDEDMKKLHEDKLRILQAIQGVRSDSVTTQINVIKNEDTSSKGIIWNTIEQGTLVLWHSLICYTSTNTHMY